MKLSFYYKSGHPSVYRFLNQLCVFVALYLFFAIAGVMCLGLMENMFYSMRFDFNRCVGSLIGIAGTLAVFLTWRKDRQVGLGPRRRISITLATIAATLLVISVISISNRNIDVELQFISVLVFLAAYWSLTPVRNSSHVLSFNDDSLWLSYRSFSPEVKRFHTLPLILFGVLDLWYFALIVFGSSDAVRERMTMLWLVILIFSVWWFYMFRREILNGRHRFKKTSVFLCFCVSIAVSVLLCYVLVDTGYDYEVLGPVLAIPLIVISSMLLLRRNKGEVQAFFESEIRKTKFDYNMHCPVCNYNMSGLSKLRCPECGTQYSVGRIVEENEYLRRPDLWLN